MRLIIMIVLLGFASSSLGDESSLVKATEEQLSQLKQAFIDDSSLKDPFSVQLKSVVVNNNGEFCGYYNAKNSLGGYVGFNKFFAWKGKRVSIKNGERKESTKWVFEFKKSDKDIFNNQCAAWDP